VTLAAADVRPIRSTDFIPAAIDADSVAAAGSPAASRSATLVAARSPRRSDAPPSREVLNAARALREMPPFAREREIDSGRYSHFSPEERAQLRKLVQ